MSKFSKQIRTEFNREICIEVAKKALIHCGFQISTTLESCIKAAEPSNVLFSFANPVSVEIEYFSNQDSPAILDFRGSNFGWGFIQDSHVEKKITELISQFLQIQGPYANVNNLMPTIGKRVMINDYCLTAEEIQTLSKDFGIQFYEGNFWYDANSGAWGYKAGPTAGYLADNLPIRYPLRSDASNGQTGIYVNGRQLPLQDLVDLQQAFPTIFQGYYWLDGLGNFGLIGGPFLGNLRQIVQSQATGKRKSLLTTWDKTDCTVIGDQFHSR